MFHQIEGGLCTSRDTGERHGNTEHDPRKEDGGLRETGQFHCLSIFSRWICVIVAVMQLVAHRDDLVKQFSPERFRTPQNLKLRSVLIMWCVVLDF